MKSQVTILFLSLMLGHNSLVSQDFYPLQVENLWQYKVYFQGEFRGYYTLSIKGDSVMPNGKKYFLFTDGDAERMGDLLVSYRYDSKNYDGDTSTTELVLNRFSAPIGTSWQSFEQPVGPEGVVAKMEGSQFTSWFGEIIETKEVSYHTQSGLFGARNYYSKKHGLIFYVAEGGASYELTGARIGGVIYGVITNVTSSRYELPDNFVVHEPFPNPFNVSTTINYEVYQAGSVIIRIYGMLGNLVKSFHHEKIVPGKYSVRWNLVDDSGQKLPSGVYFLNIDQNAKRVAKKRIAIQ